MKCPRCGEESASAGEVDIGGVMGCFVCKPEKSSFSPDLHNMIGNKHYPSMTWAMEQRIRTRRLSEDGKRVIKQRRWQ